MSDVSESTKESIDNMSIEELKKEINKDSSSVYQGEKFKYLKFVYDTKKTQADDDKYQQLLSLAKEANEIAKSSNNISEKSNQIANTAKIVSIISAIAAVVAAVFSGISYIK